MPETEGGPNLKEHTDLVSPEIGAHETDIFSDPKSGRNRGGGQAHGYDDHRSQHIDEFKRRFARQIRDETTRMVEVGKFTDVVLAAQPKMLGLLRDEFAHLTKAGVTVQHLAKDLIKFSPHEIHAHLANEKLVPPRQNPG
jgi:protein required for attachment to host cells